MMEDLEEFKDWLSIERNISRRGASDVASRLRRANSFHNFDFDSEDDIEVQIAKMSRKGGYRKLSYSIRSQLRLSVRRYTDFLSARTK
jgi:hypothetical protein